MAGKENREGQGRKPLARKNKEASESGEINVMVMRTEAIWNYIVLEKKTPGKEPGVSDIKL